MIRRVLRWWRLRRGMRDSDPEQVWIEVEVVTDPGDPGPLGLELYSDFMGAKKHLADLSRITIDARGARHHWKRVR